MVEPGFLWFFLGCFIYSCKGLGSIKGVVAIAIEIDRNLSWPWKFESPRMTRMNGPRIDPESDERIRIGQKSRSGNRQSFNE